MELLYGWFLIRTELEDIGSRVWYHLRDFLISVVSTSRVRVLGGSLLSNKFLFLPITYLTLGKWLNLSYKERQWWCWLLRIIVRIEWNYLCTALAQCSAQSKHSENTNCCIYIMYLAPERAIEYLLQFLITLVVIVGIEHSNSGQLSWKSLILRHPSGG